MKSILAAFAIITCLALVGCCNDGTCDGGDCCDPVTGECQK